MASVWLDELALPVLVALYAWLMRRKKKNTLRYASLSIVKEAVDCHQGRIEVQSTEGEGSQFTVMLPASTVTA